MLPQAAHGVLSDLDDVALLTREALFLSQPRQLLLVLRADHQTFHTGIDLQVRLLVVRELDPWFLRPFLNNCAEPVGVPL